MNGQGLLKKTAFLMDMQWPLKRMDGKTEGVSVLYMKGNNKIDLITTTKQLEILRVK
ncbi:hypothetical protein [Peribacillus sp. FSL R5-0717]|uniref:hypothetical protein n=1 Tax=Peribacillus sp. FSL R5-0717 TaxID=2975308 RepID=UPI0030FC1F2E